MKKILIPITILLIVMFCVMATNNEPEYIKEDTLMYKSITMEEAKEIFKEKGNYIIVDVRRPDEYNEDSDFCGTADIYHHVFHAEQAP